MTDRLLDDDTENPKQVSRATELVALISSQGRLYRTPDGDVYARVRIGQHEENIQVRSRHFRTWVMSLYHSKHERTVGERAISEAIGTLEGQTLMSGADEEVHLRTARHGGKFYYFLADREHTVIEIDGDGWRPVSNPPVNFVKTRSMKAQPMPRRGGTVEMFRKHFNVEEGQLSLLMAFLTFVFVPDGPYPVLNLNGEQGTGKTTATRKVKRLVDPTDSEDRAAPSSPRDMMIAAKNEFVIAWDNLSQLSK
jgi:putative DNA primase/helicase